MHGGAVGKDGALYCLFHLATSIHIHSARRSEGSQHQVCFWEHDEATSLPALCHSSIGDGRFREESLCKSAAVCEFLFGCPKIFAFLFIWLIAALKDS